MNEVKDISKETKKVNLKVTFGIIFACLFLYSLANEFVVISTTIKIPVLYMHEVKGAYLALIGAHFYIYSLFTKKNKIYYLSIIIMFLGFGYTFYTCLNLNSVLADIGEIATANIKYGVGLIAYVASFILLIIDIFIPDKAFKKDKVQNENHESIEKVFNIDSQYLDGQYIFANYIYGLFKRADLYNKLCVLVSKEDKGDLQIFIQSEKIDVINIFSNDLISVSLKSSVIMNESREIVADDDAADTLLLTTLFGTWGALASGYVTKFKVQMNQYNKVSFNKVFEIEIVYMQDNEKQKLLLKTKENPEVFLKKFKEKYHPQFN